MLGKAAARCVILTAAAVLLILPSAVVPGVSDAPERGLPVLTGQVRDGSGDGIGGAVIRLISGDWSQFNYTFTGPDGRYSINCTFSGPAVIESERSGYLKYRSDPFVIGTENLTHDLVLHDLPPEAEFVQGTITFDDGSYAQGVEVRLEHRSGNDYYDYTATTNLTGSFKLTVFEGDYSVRMSYEGITVVEEDLSVDLGGGPYYLDRVIVPVPEAGTTVKGYVDDGSVPLEGAVVVLMDQGRELQVAAVTNETGYYETSFWGGRHVLLAMYPGSDSYFSWTEVPDEGTLWSNITLLRLEFSLFGVVFDTAGYPVEGMTVSLFRPHLLPGSCSDVTDASGGFGIEVSGGPGYVVASGEDPFEPGEYDLFIEEMPTLGADIFMNITVHPPEDQAMASTLEFDGWDTFSMEATMDLSVNRTRYMRLFVDSMVGDGDLVLSEGEFGAFYDMMAEDPEMDGGPLGLNTSENLTVDGYFYDRTGYTLEFQDLSGPVSGLDAAHIDIAAEYAINGTLPGMVHHSVMLNMTYDDPGTVSAGTGIVPVGWLVGGCSSGMVQVDPDGERFTIRPGKDPNASDDIEWEMVSIEVYMDDLSVNATFPQAYEGDVSRYSVRIHDTVPDNVYDQIWHMGDGGVVNTTGRFNYSYGDEGIFNVLVELKDRFGRVRDCSGNVTVLNKAPSVEVSVDRQRIGEGEDANISLTAFDVPADLLSVSWSTGANFTDPAPLTDATDHLLFRPGDEGNYTVRARVSDEDGGTTLREIVITAFNKDPEIVTELVLPRANNVTYENETVTIRIVSAIDVDELAFDLDVSRTDFRMRQEGSIFEIDVLNQGRYDLMLTVTDGDGGSATDRWSVQVSVNESLDHDRDGIPMWWEKENGLDDNMKADGGSDPDGDGLTNYEEYIQRSDPRDPDDPVVLDDDEGFPIWIVFAAAILVLVASICIILYLRSRRAFEIEE